MTINFLIEKLPNKQIENSMDSNWIELDRFRRFKIDPVCTGSFQIPLSPKTSGHLSQCKNCLKRNDHLHILQVDV